MFAHPHHFTARASQIIESNIADAKRHCKTLLRLGCMRREDAIADLRAVGCFEAEIAAVLS